MTRTAIAVAAAAGALALAAAGCAGTASVAEPAAPSHGAEAPVARPGGAPPVRSAPFALVPDGPGDAVRVTAAPGADSSVGVRVANASGEARRFALAAGPWLSAPAAVTVPPRRSVPVPVRVRVPGEAEGRRLTSVTARPVGGGARAAVRVAYEATVRVEVRVERGPRR